MNMKELHERVDLRVWEESDFEDSTRLNYEAEKDLGIPPETGGLICLELKKLF